MAKQYHKNPRQITAKQYEALAIDLAELGDLGGIVHDLNSDEIIGGNQRSRVFDINACDVVLTEVLPEPDAQGTVAHGYVLWRGNKYAYRQVRWTERQAEKANVVANKRGGSWDFDILADQFDAGDLLEWGFEPFELGLDDAPKETGDTEPQIDRAEELREKWGVKSGDLWLLDSGKGYGHRLVCGDCTDAATVARVMGGEKAQAVVTDPPYNVDYGANANPRWRVRTIVNDKMSDDDWHDFMCSWLNQALSVSEGAFYIFMSDKELVSVTQCFKECGGHWSSYITWVKDRFVLGLKDYHSRCERALYGWREGGKHQFHGGRDKDDVWEFPRPGNSDEHPTMKPVELFARAIEMSSSAGDVAYDPFLGSGTTIIACENLHRRARACEISPAYVAVALQRFADHTNVAPVLLEAAG